MAEIMKKKRNEVIQKVKVKMWCNCVGQSCGCTCTMNTNPTVTEHSNVDAAECLAIHTGLRYNPDM